MPELAKIPYKTNLSEGDWTAMKAKLADDDFDNGRSADQLRTSFENSYATVIAYDDSQIIGTARVLSDGCFKGRELIRARHSP